jgi:hypothetical protein
MAKVGFTLKGQDFEFETDVETAVRLLEAGKFCGPRKNLWHITRLSVDYGIEVRSKVPVTDIKLIPGVDPSQPDWNLGDSIPRPVTPDGGLHRVHYFVPDSLFGRLDRGQTGKIDIVPPGTADPIGFGDL